MTPLEIRRQLFKAANTGDKYLALEMAIRLKDMDAFIGERAKPTGHEKLLTASGFPGRCNHCGEQIPAGVAIQWGKGVGQWHLTCYEEVASGGG